MAALGFWVDIESAILLGGRFPLFLYDRYMSVVCVLLTRLWNVACPWQSVFNILGTLYCLFLGTLTWMGGIRVVG